MGSMNDRRNAGTSHSSVERGGEMARLKAGSRATMEELQEFLGEVRGKNPQQVMGLVAASGLTQGIILSTLATALVLFAFTAVPYYYYDDSAAVAAEKAKKAEAAAAEKAEEEKAEAEANKEDSAEDKKAAAVKAMTGEFDEAKGAKGEMPDIDDLLK
jgi:hypothetical protein